MTTTNTKQVEAGRRVDLQLALLATGTEAPEWVSVWCDNFSYSGPWVVFTIQGENRKQGEVVRYSAHHVVKILPDAHLDLPESA